MIGYPDQFHCGSRSNLSRPPCALHSRAGGNVVHSITSTHTGYLNARINLESCHLI
jgi:hypothetical protein